MEVLHNGCHGRRKFMGCTSPRMRYSIGALLHRCAGLAVGTGLCVASANAYNQVRHRAPPSALHIATARAPRTLSPASRFPRATPPAAVDRGAL